MPTQINGSTGVSKVQDGSVTQADLAANVAGNGPAFSAYRSPVVQSITSTPVVMVCNVDIYDTHNAYDTSTGLFTAPVSGIYMFSALAHFATASYIVAMFLNVNASLLQRIDSRSVPSGACFGTTFVPLTAGDTVSISLTSATTQNTEVSDPSLSRFSGCLVRVA